MDRVAPFESSATPGGVVSSGGRPTVGVVAVGVHRWGRRASRTRGRFGSSARVGGDRRSFFVLQNAAWVVGLERFGTGGGAFARDEVWRRGCRSPSAVSPTWSHAPGRRAARRGQISGVAGDGRGSGEDGPLCDLRHLPVQHDRAVRPSALYQLFPVSPTGVARLRRLDHMTIFVLMEFLLIERYCLYSAREGGAGNPQQSYRKELPNWTSYPPPRRSPTTTSAWPPASGAPSSGRSPSIRASGSSAPSPNAASSGHNLKPLQRAKHRLVGRGCRHLATRKIRSQR